MKIAVIDIGGTMIKAGVFEKGKVTGMQSVPTEALLGGKAVIEKAAELVRSMPSCSAIGISTAGQVDMKTGNIIYANDNFPGYTGARVRSVFERKFGVSVAVENDVNAAAVGEGKYGAGRKRKDFLMLTYGTGIGGAIVLDGKLYHGSSCSAGEFGGIVTHPADIVREKVFSGCYENYGSASALVKRVERIRPELTDGEKIFKQIGDTAVKKEVDAWMDEITYGLVSLIHVFNPSAVILGGGVMSQKSLVDGIRKRVMPLLAGGFEKTEILGAELKNSAGLMGAAVLAEEKLKIKTAKSHHMKEESL